MEIRRIAMAYNNVYAVESGGARVLIDTGPDYRGARELLLEALDGWQPDLVVATHAHIVIAGPGATARNVAQLAARMAAAVQEKFGFELEPEVRYWGDVAGAG